MIVEIDLFSGRPNPRWQVDDGVRREVEAIEERLKPAVGREMDLPGLGYRGFVYAGDGVSRRAFGEMLEREGIVFDDPERAIERLLLKSMPGELAEVRKRVAGLLP